MKIAFELSGGLDSSSIVAAAATLERGDITTYTLKVRENDEEPYARTIRDRYPIDYRVVPDPEIDFFRDAHRFAAIMEEPYHSPNVYTHYQLCRHMKSDGMAVVLSGSGGDEILAGYEGDFWAGASRELRRTGHRAQAAAYGLAMRFRSWERARRQLRTHVTKWDHIIRKYGADPRKLLRRLGGVEPATGRHNDHPSHRSPAYAHLKRYKSIPFHDQCLYNIQIGYLPYYHVVNDHFMMAIPLEHRCPFMDYRLVEFGLQLPAAHLFKNGWTKYILRKAMEPFLPAQIVWRREKMGFPFPIRSFLSNHGPHLAPLFDLVKDSGLLNGLVADYRSLCRDDPTRLWRICSTGLWLRSFERS